MIGKEYEDSDYKQYEFKITKYSCIDSCLRNSGSNRLILRGKGLLPGTSISIPLDTTDIGIQGIKGIGMGI